MTYPGRVQNGVIILDPPNALPEGAQVTVEPVEQPPDPQTTSQPNPLLALAGTIEGLPPDFAQNHDHYIHGTPKNK